MTTNNILTLDTIIEGIQNRKGHNIVTVDMSHIQDAAASAFVIAEGTSPTQVSAIADSVRDYALQTQGIKPYNYDGYKNAEWIVIDYGHVLVHVFVPEARKKYNLEELWSDAIINEIPDIY